MKSIDTPSPITQKVMPMTAPELTGEELYWTFSYEGEIYDGEFESKDAAVEYAEEYLHEKLEPEKGCEWAEPIEVIQFKYDDDGKMIITFRDDDQVEISNWGSDYEQHSTWRL